MATNILPAIFVALPIVALTAVFVLFQDLSDRGPDPLDSDIG